MLGNDLLEAIDQGVCNHLGHHFNTFKESDKDPGNIVILYRHSNLLDNYTRTS